MRRINKFKVLVTWETPIGEDPNKEETPIGEDPNKEETPIIAYNIKELIN